MKMQWIIIIIWFNLIISWIENWNCYNYYIKKWLITLIELNFFLDREHFHCLDCNPRVFVKKEEMIRHFKWHKKRDESLQHGFMRYSPMDDCSDRFRSCSHNRKQTHYHCLKVLIQFHSLLLAMILWIVDFDSFSFSLCFFCDFCWFLLIFDHFSWILVEFSYFFVILVDFWQF